MKTSRRFLTYAACLLLSASLAKAQTLTMSNNTQSLILKGTIAGRIVTLRNRSFLIIDVMNDATKAVETWVVQGSDKETLEAAGWVFPQPPSEFPPQRGERFRNSASYSGQRVTIVAFRPTPDRTVAELFGSDTVLNEVPPNASEGPIARLATGGPRVDLADQLKTQRFVYGTEVTFADGKKLMFGKRPSAGEPEAERD